MPGGAGDREDVAAGAANHLGGAAGQRALDGVGAGHAAAFDQNAVVIQAVGEITARVVDLAPARQARDAAAGDDCRVGAGGAGVVDD